MNSSRKRLSGIEIFNVIIALVSLFLAIGGLYQNQRISEQEQEIKNFDSLLHKVNRQLELATHVQTKANHIAEVNDIGNMNKLYSSVVSLGTQVNFKDAISSWSEETQYNFINDVKTILEAQLNNACLVANTTLMQSWVNAYVHTHLFTTERPWGDEFGPEFGGRTRTRLDELNRKQYDRDFISCWEAINHAYVHAVKFIRNDKRFSKVSL